MLLNLENSSNFAPMKRTPIEDVTPDNVEQLANDISNGRLLFERFSPQEQRGFTKGGRRHVIASLLAGRSNSASPAYQERDDFKRERQLGAAQHYTTLCSPKPPLRYNSYPLQLLSRGLWGSLLNRT